MIIPSRRRFLIGAAALLAAPAIVRASNLMPISVLKPPKLWGDGIHDDTEALQAIIDRQAPLGDVRLPQGRFRAGPLNLALHSHTTVFGNGATLLAASSMDFMLRLTGRDGVSLPENITLRDFRFESHSYQLRYRDPRLLDLDAK